MLITAMLLSLTLQTLPEPVMVSADPQAHDCQYWRSSAALALYQDLESKDIVCNGYALGYVEGVYDVAIGTYFKQPPNKVNMTYLMGIVRNFMVANHSHLKDTEARYVIVMAFRDAFGDVEEGR